MPAPPSDAEAVTALEPCPFCGGTAAAREGHRTSYVMCLSCEAVGEDCGYGGLINARAAWNRRTPTAAADRAATSLYDMPLEELKSLAGRANAALAHRILGDPVAGVTVNFGNKEIPHG
jgi:hypothetical protein